MEINISHCVRGAEKAEGIAVIIDLFRAFSTSAYILNNSAEKIITVAGINEAFELKKQNPNYILIGEKGGIKIEGFDYGNSPDEVHKVDFIGKTAVLRSSAGTQGIHAAKHADEMFLGNLLNAKALSKYILFKSPKKVSLVCMGEAGEHPSPEDALNALYIRDLLLKREPDKRQYWEFIRYGAESSQKFFVKNSGFAENDFHLCMDFDKFNFIMRVNEKGIVTKEYF